MAKPICVIKINPLIPEKFNINDAQSMLQRSLYDYHVLVMPSKNKEAEFLEVQVFNDAEMEITEHQKLVDYIMDSVNELK